MATQGSNAWLASLLPAFAALGVTPPAIAPRVAPDTGPQPTPVAPPLNPSDFGGAAPSTVTDTAPSTVKGNRREHVHLGSGSEQVRDRSRLAFSAKAERPAGRPLDLRPIHRATRQPIRESGRKDSRRCQRDESNLVDPSTGVLYDTSGQMLPQYLQTYVNGSGPGGGMTDYQAAQLAETQRQNRLQEAQQAIQNIMSRAQQTNADTLSAAPYAVNPGTQYFPGFGPNDPAARAGLISPTRITPIGFNPAAVNASTDPNQIAADLARIRQAAGVGG